MASSKRNLISSENFPTIILSAGLGERFRPHTDILPKPAIPFLNIPFLYYSMHLAEYLGTEKIVINTHHLAEKVRSVAAEAPSSIDIIFTEEQPKILGSAGGMRNARRFLEGSGSFLVLNADSVFLIKDFSFWQNIRKMVYEQNALAIIVLTPHPKVGSLYNGVWLDEKNNVKGFSKTAPAKNTRGLHYTGVLLLNDEIFDFIPDKPCDIFHDVIKPLLDQEKVMGYEVPGLWYEGGSEKGYLEDTQKALTDLSGLTKKNLIDFNGNNYLGSLLQRFWSDFNQRDKILNKENTLIHSSANVSPKAKLEGFNVIGPNVTIEEHAVVKNSVIVKGTIKSEDRVENKLVL
jgi:mannose-1-phosphate guanylyltransferase